MNVPFFDVSLPPSSVGFARNERNTCSAALALSFAAANRRELDRSRSTYYLLAI